MTPTLFVGGTGSNAGKSWMVTAICAWLRAQGVSVAPFKAQNMSNHSYPCSRGGEIGRAQVAQAEACGLEPEPAMNPILLKPSGAGTSQVIVNGRMWKTLTAREYYAAVDSLRPVVLEAYHDLASRFDAVIIEGAGSVSELNLRDHDLVNLELVKQIRAPWMLVADIERGGVFASVYGTVALLSDEERALLRGFAINKFHGDLTLFDEGVRTLEAKTDAPCLGVFPYDAGIHLDAEDSLAVRIAPLRPAPMGARIAIIRFPHLSNATDFRLLDWAEWVTAPSSVDFDFVILPGTKSTMADLAWLRERGLADWVAAERQRGATVVGICGGFQMLGARIDDPRHLESEVDTMAGLSWLPVSTELATEKRTRSVVATTPGGVRFGGYEIHVGVTPILRTGDQRPFAHIVDGGAEGVWGDRIIGTYLHGAFEHPGVCREVFGVNLEAVAKDDHYRRLGEWFGQHGRHLEALGFNGLVRSRRDALGTS